MLRPGLTQLLPGTGDGALEGVFESAIVRPASSFIQPLAVQHNHRALRVERYEQIGEPVLALLLAQSFIS